MADEVDRVRPDEARAALESVEEMKRAGARRGVPPRWVGTVVSLIAGGLIAAPAFDDGGLVTVFLILALGVVLSSQRGRAGAWTSEFPGGPWKTAATVSGSILVFLALMSMGIVLRDAFDLWWGPLVSGTVAVIVVFALSENERREARSDAGAGSGA